LGAIDVGQVLRVPKDVPPMVIEELGTRRKPFRAPDRSTLALEELALDGFVREIGSEYRADDQPEAAVEADQSPVEGFVEVRHETQAVARVQPLLGELAPWQNVAGDEQVFDRIRAPVETSNSSGVAADRRWLDPLLHALSAR
jgi:hypothetical protein